MRLLTRRIYRAFPELDRYSDGQCERFMKAARGGRMRRMMGCVVLAVVAAPLFVGSLMGVARLIEFQFGRFDPLVDGPLPGRLIGLVGFAVLMAPAPFAAIVARDLLLRRRVRFVLRVRGVCRSCWYSLVGLPILPDHRVKCPECGTEAEVDPSLGELTVDADGRTRYKPEITPPDLAARFWNPSRRRILRRKALWSLAVIIVVGGGTIGGYEVFLRMQAAAARASMLGQKGLEALPVRYGVPAPVAGEEDPLELINQVDALAGRVANDLTEEVPSASTLSWSLRLVYSSATNRARFGLAPSPTPAELATAREYLDRCNAAGLNGLLDRLAVIRGAIAFHGIASDGDPTVPNVGWDGTIAFVLPIANADAKFALEGGDRARAARSIEHSLAMVRLLNAAPLSYGVYQASLHESDILDRIVESLMPPVPPQWPDTISGVLDRQEVSFAPEYHAEVERFWADQTIAWIFSDPGNVRLGKYGSKVAAWVRPGGTKLPAGRLGTYAENKRVVTSRFDALSARSKQEPWERTGAPPPPPQAGSLILPRIWALGWSTSWSQDARDISLLRRRGIRAMIAIERYRATNGRYPSKLADLVPEFLAAEPRDPFTGRGLAYRTIDPAADRFGRGYLLYSIGADGVDDGGRTNPTDPTFPLKSASGAVSTTSDYVINEPPPP